MAFDKWGIQEESCCATVDHGFSVGAAISASEGCLHMKMRGMGVYFADGAKFTSANRVISGRGVRSEG